MDATLLRHARSYARNYHEEEVRLLSKLAAIPSPTHHEGRREAFVADWLRRQGAKDVRIDEQGNVLCLLRGRHPRKDGKPRDVAVFSAHTDIVFPDTDPLPVRIEHGRMMAPGVGDDTANLVALMAATRHLLHDDGAYDRATRDVDILVVADTCEEGLGNLAGTRALFEGLRDKGRHVRSFCSFDLYLSQCISHAVGSERFRIRVKTQGGHSYQNFGRPNAVEVLCQVIEALYAIELPVDPDTGAKTTINVGHMEGGGTANSIASQAGALFEFRSESAANLKRMEGLFRAALDSCRRDGVDIEVETIGVRPGNGPVDARRLAALAKRSADTIRSVTGRDVDASPASTDANIPLSLGIPSICVGAVRGSLLHTRDEWVDLASLEDGLALVLSLMLQASDAL